MARMAASIAHVQLTPNPGGFAAIQPSHWATNAAAYRASPVSQWAWPSVTHWWQRESSQTRRTSDERARSR